jgi:putative hemolysin
MVIDEYGGLAGLVTVDDIMEAIVGDIGEEDDENDPLAVQRADGSWLIDGMMTFDEFSDLFEIREEEKDARFVTVGGLVMAILAEIPKTGDSFIWMGLTVEVVDMDGHRVDKVLVQIAEEESARQEEPVDKVEK